MRLRVLTTWREIVPERLEGATAVVIDAFLATTTLLTILENGARRVFPAASLDEVDAVCGRLDAALRLRGGEQNAAPVDGFECGPYPDEYPPWRVRGKDVVFVSTNGTRTIGLASAAERLLVASLRNAPAVGRYLDRCGADSVYLICAGSHGRLSLEDLVGAAMILDAMDTSRWRMNDAAWLAAETARHYPDAIVPLRASRAGRWMLEHGRADTFDYVAAVGASDLLAEVRDGELRRVDAASRCRPAGRNA